MINHSFARFVTRIGVRPLQGTKMPVSYHFQNLTPHRIQHEQSKFDVLKEIYTGICVRFTTIYMFFNIIDYTEVLY